MTGFSWDEFVDRFLDGTIRFEDDEVHLSVEDWNQMWENIRREMRGWELATEEGAKSVNQLTGTYVDCMMKGLWLAQALRLREGDRVEIDADTYQGEGIVDRRFDDDHFLTLPPPGSDKLVVVGVRLIHGHNEVRYYDIRDLKPIPNDVD